MFAEGVGEHAGRGSRHQAIEERRADSDRDQGEHVVVAAPERGPAALEEGPACPQHDWRGKGELYPRRPAHRHEMQPCHLRAHRDEQQRHRQHSADPEAAGEIEEFGVGAAICARLGGLERHAANRAGAGRIAPDFRMHRAGPRRRRGGDRQSRGLRLQISFGIGDELCPATGTAEMIARILMFGMMRGRARIDVHPAHGVGHGARCGDVSRTAMASVRVRMIHHDAPLHRQITSDARLSRIAVLNSQLLAKEASRIRHADRLPRPASRCILGRDGGVAMGRSRARLASHRRQLLIASNFSFLARLLGCEQSDPDGYCRQRERAGD